MKMSDLRPAIENIQELSIRKLVYDTLRLVKEFFETAPASFEHHSEDERRPGGLILHTLRAAKIAEMLLERANIKRGTLEWDCVIAAVILHDIGKAIIYSIEDEKVRRLLSPGHTAVGAALVVKYHMNNSYADRIAQLIRSHMSHWFPWEAQPDDELGRIVADADYLAYRLALEKDLWESDDSDTSVNEWMCARCQSVFKQDEIWSGWEYPQPVPGCPYCGAKSWIPHKLIGGENR